MTDTAASTADFSRAVPSLFAQIPVEGVDIADLDFAFDTDLALDLLEDLGLIGRDGDARVYRTEA